MYCHTVFSFVKNLGSCLLTEAVFCYYGKYGGDQKSMKLRVDYFFTTLFFMQIKI